ncbi:MAG: hypothetical protein JW736_00405 [Deltaproteobacteria bacterium]|nr:hypothetical protein [Deltaproteobacteria bacterium]MBN2686805.1 hypothetical protein [Deltaproteobacteria bacterium]
MIASSLDDIYRGSLLPAVMKVSEVLPATAGGRSLNREQVLPAYRPPVSTHCQEANGQLLYYGRTSASSSRHSIGPRVYRAKGTYIDTWA